MIKIKELTKHIFLSVLLAVSFASTIKCIQREPAYNFTAMLTLMKQHREFSQAYHTKFDSFVKNKKNKDLVNTTLLKISAEMNRLRRHIRFMLNSPYHDVPRKKLKEFKDYDSSLTRAYRELKKIHEVLCEYPSVKFNVS